ncbi:hypothetical protein CFC21_007754 [Triticum aestivum]|uniref:DUF1618 domain-containing protein n=2 Tax=Triticum aestivum TaxID=4565 RepID=A0A3B5Z198_WHEAT|nr:uncharacterized protein LOC119348397 [Triticum dicoccoides]XP_044411986.1 uncharacterized protein LOC123136617 [Triticum aestivum]XP_044411999.1 uncharacterized protein LOC123136617 [Triticum aestivum]KAF6990585.1 hypothetical protein CFC21_007754 [Triticum aestivum]
MGSRFVNLLARSCNGGPRHFSLHRMNPANLFHPTRSAVPAVQPLADAPLPPPALSFGWPGKKGELAWMNFMAFGRTGNNFLAVDQIGRTFFYDTDSRSLRTGMPMMCKPIMDPISIAVGDSLYVMSGNPGPSPGKHCFQALIHGRLPASDTNDWSWYSLQPPPPFVNDIPRFHEDEVKSSCGDVPAPYEIGAYTVVGESQIWVSTAGAGTYSYDTVSGAWSKVGNWSLPFRGRAEYIPEHNLWFGFTPNNLQLCTSDLTASSEVRPPVLQNMWTDVVRPKNWTLRDASLVPLGSGKVCIARFFVTHSDNFEDMSAYKKRENFAVLEGVEVLKAGWAHLRMVKHKSERYVFGRDLVIPL